MCYTKTKTNTRYTKTEVSLVLHWATLVHIYVTLRLCYGKKITSKYIHHYHYFNYENFSAINTVTFSGYFTISFYKFIVIKKTRPVSTFYRRHNILTNTYFTFDFYIVTDIITMAIRFTLLVALCSVAYGDYYGPSSSPSQAFFGGRSSLDFTYQVPDINFASVIPARNPPARLPVNGFG